MVVSVNPFVIVIHILAFILCILASKGIGVTYEERRGVWHLGWLALALLILAVILVDFGVVK